MKDSTKNILIACAAGSAMSFSAYKALSEVFFNRTFKRNDKNDPIEPQISAWLNRSNVKEVKITSYDGLKLAGLDIHNHLSKHYLIMVHGIWHSKAQMYERGYEFDKLGYNLLLVDQRSSGESEGKYYTYGQKESLDILKWIDYLIELEPDCKITLYGLSMGAATCMMTTRSTLPKNVVSIIEDCGFSTLKDEIDNFLRLENVNRTGFILSMIEKKMVREFGMTYDDCSPKKALENNEIPILFIHGEDDDFVPFSMSRILYNHNKGPKKYFSVKGKKHTEAMQDERYFKVCDDFIRNCSL